MLDKKSFLQDYNVNNTRVEVQLLFIFGLLRGPVPGRLGASTGQKYSSTSTSTWKNDAYKYKYKYWIFKSTWVQVQVL